MILRGNKQYISLKDRLTQNGNSNELKDFVFNNILPEMISNSTPLSKAPKAIILGGLSGAGKSGLRSKILDNFEKDFIKIDTDDLRDKLPNNAKINFLYGDKASLISQPDSGLAGVYIRNHCLANSFNYLVDSTLRTADSAKIEVSKAITNNFATEVHLLAVSEYEALQGVFQRYLIQKRDGKNPRFVEPDYVKQSYKTISLSAKEVSNHEVNEFKIYNRAGDILYDKNIHFNLSPEDVFKNQNQNFIKNLSANDAKEFLDEWDRIENLLLKLQTDFSIIEKLENEKVNFCEKFLQNSMISENIKFSIVKESLSKSSIFFDKIWSELNDNVEDNNMSFEESSEKLKRKYPDNFVDIACKLELLSRDREVSLSDDDIKNMTFDKAKDIVMEHDFVQMIYDNSRRNVSTIRLK